VTALWAASGGVSSLGQALNRCYDVRETRPFWRSRGNAVLVTLVATVVGILAATILFFVPVLGKFIGGTLGALLAWLRFPVAGAMVVGLWAFLYWALPNVRPKFQLVTPGSLVGTGLWLLASWGFSQYVVHFGRYEAIYGTLGGVIVLLVWMWISSIVVLLGAEINKVLTPERRLKESKTGERRLKKKERPPVPKGELVPD
jgi:membrane protein